MQTVQTESLVTDSVQKLNILEFTSGFNRIYAELATNSALPEKYIQGRNYQKVKEFLQCNRKLKFTGPKGVGKSVCLLAYWQKFIKDGKKAILMGINTIKNFNENDSIKRYLQSLHNDFLIPENTTGEATLKSTVSKYINTEQPVVLLDLTFMSAHEDDILSLLWSCKSAKTCLLAMSSGSGSGFRDSRNEEKLYNALTEFKAVEFLPFNKTEAILFARIMRLPKEEVGSIGGSGSSEASHMGSSSSGKQTVMSRSVVESSSSEGNLMFDVESSSSLEENVLSVEDALSEKGVRCEEEACIFIKQLQPYAAYNPYLLYCALEHVNKRADSLAVCSYRTQKFIERTLPHEGNPFFLHK